LIKDRRIREWKSNLVHSDAALSQWLKSKVNPVGIAVNNVQGQIAETDVQAAEVIFDYWQSFWNERDILNPPVSDRVQSCPVYSSWCGPPPCSGLAAPFWCGVV
jgi:hypothetical protein